MINSNSFIKLFSWKFTQGLLLCQIICLMCTNPCYSQITPDMNQRWQLGRKMDSLEKIIVKPLYTAQVMQEKRECDLGKSQFISDLRGNDEEHKVLSEKLFKLKQGHTDMHDPQVEKLMQRKFELESLWQHAYENTESGKKCLQFAEGINKRRESLLKKSKEYQALRITMEKLASQAQDSSL